MIKIIVATHGELAQGMLNSIQMIGGENENLFSLAVYPEEGQEMARKKISDLLDKLGKEDEIIVLTDIMGGNITNLFTEFVLGHKLHIVTGVNLPMLLEMMYMRETLPIEEVVQRGMEQAREGIVNVSELINNHKSSF